MNRRRRTGIFCTPPGLGAFVLLLSCATLPAHAPARAAGPAAPGTFTGQLLPGPVKELAPGKLLVAARELLDPNFSETVVLLADYNRQGAMGVIINRRTQVPVARLFPTLKQAPGQAPRLYLGGPVAATGVLGLLRSEAPRKDSRHVIGDLYLVASREPLEALIASGVGPSRFRVYLGYAGWAPGQLESETAHGSWHVVQGEVDVVFDSDPGSVWQRQIRRTEERMVRRGTGFCEGGTE